MERRCGVVVQGGCTACVECMFLKLRMECNGIRLRQFQVQFVEFPLRFCASYNCT